MHLSCVCFGRELGKSWEVEDSKLGGRGVKEGRCRMYLLIKQNDGLERFFFKKKGVRGGKKEGGGE